MNYPSGIRFLCVFMDQSPPISSHECWFPREVSIVGGGLWARVIAEELCKTVPPDVAIRIHSTHCTSLLHAWADRVKLAARIQISSLPPVLEGHDSHALIVVNAARDHAKVVEQALPSKTPLLVEKPFTLSAAETQRLITQAAATGTPLAASHVFLFARYLENFCALIADERVNQIEISWADPNGEVRHGERKSFDPSLPLHLDVLPHISSILGALRPDLPQSCTAVAVKRGGAELKVDVLLDAIPCYVRLARNADQRQRHIEVSTNRRRYTLDFTTTPQVTTCDGTMINPDPDWGIKAGPLATMLKAFLLGTEGGAMDPRLSPKHALLSNQLADQAGVRYRQAMVEWITETLPKATADGEDPVRYALRERFCAGRYADAAAIEAQVTTAIQRLRGASADDVIDFIEQES
jgi:predicted dehydrogenase